MLLAAGRCMHWMCICLIVGWLAEGPTSRTRATLLTFCCCALPGLLLLAEVAAPLICCISFAAGQEVQGATRGLPSDGAVVNCG